MSDRQARLIAGVDEAGRGAVIGPLVVAGVLLDRAVLPDLASSGVRDSKLLTRKKRTALAEKIERLATKIDVAELRPFDIDRAVLHGQRLRRLNYIEMRAMAKIVSGLCPKVAFIDACDVNADRCAATISSLLQSDIEVVAFHHADRGNLAVSAASIIAKVRRDSRIERLRLEYGDLGSGYPSDKITIAFLERLLRRRDELPWFVRRSWKTVARLEAQVVAPDF